MKHDPRRILLALLAILGLLLASCGGGDSDDGDSVEDPTTTTAADDGADDDADSDDGGDTGDDEAAEGEDDGDGDAGGGVDDEEPTDVDSDGRSQADAESLAAAVHPTLDDFPAGYEASDDEDDDAGFSACITSVSDDQELAEAGPTTFESGDAVAMNVTTVVYESVAAAEAVIDEMTTDAFVTCGQGVIDDGFASPTGSTSLVASVDSPPIGEESVSLSGAFAPSGADGAAGISIHAVRTADVLSFVAVLDVTGGDAIGEAVATGLTAVGGRHAAVG